MRCQRPMRCQVSSQVTGKMSIGRIERTIRDFLNVCSFYTLGSSRCKFTLKGGCLQLAGGNYVPTISPRQHSLGTYMHWFLQTFRQTADLFPGKRLRLPSPRTSLHHELRLQVGDRHLFAHENTTASLGVRGRTDTPDPSPSESLASQAGVLGRAGSLCI